MPPESVRTTLSTRALSLACAEASSPAPSASRVPLTMCVSPGRLYCACSSFERLPTRVAAELCITVLLREFLDSATPAESIRGHVQQSRGRNCTLCKATSERPWCCDCDRRQGARLFPLHD